MVTAVDGLTRSPPLGARGLRAAAVRGAVGRQWG